MNTKPRNQCVPADLAWLVPLDHRCQRGLFTWPSGTRGVSPAREPPLPCCQTKPCKVLLLLIFFSFPSLVSAQPRGGSPGSSERDHLTLAGLWGGVA